MPDAPRPKSDAPPARRLLTDLAEVERHGREVAAENVRFRAWLKFRSGLPDQEADALAREAADQVWAHIDCLECGACCRALSIVLDDRDIARLAKRVGLTPAAFARLYARREGHERYFAAQPCPFLDGNACTVYEDRPKACRDFPYLHDPGFRERMLGLIEYALLCPVVLNTLEALKRRLPWRKKRGNAGHGSMETLK